MSQHEWKPGDRAMVIIERRISSQAVALKTKSGISSEVGIESLYPLPAPNPHQALRDAVVEATMMRRKGDSTSFYKLNDAINALRAALTPPKPVNPMEALRNAWDAPRGMMWAEGVQDALDAAEKAWKEKT
jgi:hypothetical protein